MVAHVLYIHLTGGKALSAVNALRSVELDTEHREAVEESVKCAERADETAEEAEYKYATDNEGNKESELPGEERSESCELARVDLVGEQSYRTLERSCRTDVLTECGKGEVAEGVRHGNNNNKELGKSSKSY